MDRNKTCLLTVNAGSSSIKFDLWEQTEVLRRTLAGRIEKIGQADATLTLQGEVQATGSTRSVEAPDHAAAAKILMDWLEQNLPASSVIAVGHRIVHGGPKYNQPCVISPEVMETLRQLIDFDLEHLPVEINLIESLQRLFPGVPQVVCFDTAFHHHLPSEAQLLPIPRRYSQQGLRRYGFHGLSYNFLVQELRRTAGDAQANSRLILAHLGNGVSLAAVHQGKSLDTTMGLTPAGGVPMSARSGDLDPGLLSYLVRVEGLGPEEFDKLVNFQSGLLGISETSSDMKELLEHEAGDERAAEAVNLFCYQIKKAVGGLAAALGGLDQLVFTGGMGENAPAVRARICGGLEFLGISLDTNKNAANAAVISAADSRVVVRVIPTDEAQIIAQEMVIALEAGRTAAQGAP